MKVVVLLAAALSAVSVPAVSFANPVPLAEERNCDLSSTFEPNCFQPRAEPVVRVLLGHYGKVFSKNDLKRIGALFKSRFEASVDGSLKLEILDEAIVPLKDQTRDFADIKELLGPKADRSPERLTRIWYYYNKKHEQIAIETYEQFLHQGHAETMKRADAVLVLSEPQFEGLGFAYGGMALIKQPAEIAWASGGGTTQYDTDPKIVDELIHELGHVLGLDHAAKHCYDGGKDWRATRACCDSSPSGTDVMSYCRERKDVGEGFFYAYSDCSKKFLRETTLPNLLIGGPRVFQPEACR